MSDEKEPAYGYSEEIMRKIVAMLLFESSVFIQNSEVIQAEYFENPALIDMVKVLKSFYKKYRRSPTADEFLEEMSLVISGSKKLPEDEYWKIVAEVLRLGEEGKFDYVKDKVVAFARCQGVKNAIISGVGFWKKQQYDKILTNVRNALAIGELHDSLGSFYYKDLDKRLKERKEGSDRADVAIKTGLTSLDNALGGGLAPGEVGILMGPTKRGKTMVGINFIVGAMLDGFDVVHYMFEGGSESRCQRMYDASIAGVSKSGLKESEAEVKKAVDEFYISPNVGHLLVKHFPPKPSVLMLENHLQKLRIMNADFKPKLLLIDYLGLMRPTEKLSGDSDRYLAFGEIIKELLSLAQRYNYAIWLLHQATRAALKKQIVDLDDAADSMEPMRDADLILTLNQTKEEGQVKGWQDMRFFIAGGREMRDRQTVAFMINKNRCQLAESSTHTVGEEGEKETVPF